LLTDASREGPKGLGCKSPRSSKGVARSGIRHWIWSDPFGQVCQTITFPTHDVQIMYRALGQAIYSALAKNTETDIGEEKMSTNSSTLYPNSAAL